jgi:DNA replication and repair protein RecF
MFLTSLTLEEFRCYRHLALELPPRGLVLTGANGSGKSTVLEAVAFLATTRSPRAGLDREMIRWESGEDLASQPYARVVGALHAGGEGVTVEIGLQLDRAGGDGAPMTRKQVKINGISRRAVDAVGTLRAVVFSPTDLDLITGSPSGRRRYLDVMLSQIDRRYIRALATYTQTITQRNALLKRFGQENRSPHDPAAQAELAYWDETLVASGAYVHAKRQAIIARLSAHAEAAFAALTEGTRPLGIEAKPSVPTAAHAEHDDEAAETVAARNFTQVLAERRVEEFRRAVSVVGPHRDDVAILHAGHDIAAYGSRGQQRLAVLAIKLAEVAVMTEATGEPPIALLDDILSELDPQHREYVLETVAAGTDRQVLITGADETLVDVPALDTFDRFRVTDGAVEPA